MAKRITQFFEEILGAELRNPQWSWGGESISSRTVFLRIWDDHFSKDRSKVQASWPWNVTGRGGRERVRHLDMMLAGRPVFGVVCHPEEYDTKGKPRSIADFDRTRFLRLGPPLVKQRGIKWATVLGWVSLEEMLEANGLESSVEGDIAEINGDKKIKATTKQQLVDARLGQGKFRQNLLALWKGRCAVTGSFTLDAVRASHIVAWKLSNNEERLDPHNGLPLNAGIDALFDRDLIAFSDAGVMLVSKSIPAQERKLLGLENRNLRLAPSKKTVAFLGRQRAVFEEKEAKR